MKFIRSLAARLAPVDYQTYLRSRRWKARAERAKRRAGYRCQICNSSMNLEVHHRTYERLGYEADDDLTVLCARCHAAATANLRRRNGNR